MKCPKCEYKFDNKKPGIDPKTKLKWRYAGFQSFYFWCPKCKDSIEAVPDDFKVKHDIRKKYLDHPGEK